MVDTRHRRRCKARVKLVCETMLGDSDDSQRAPLDVRLLRVFASHPEISRIEGECARRVAHSKRLPRQRRPTLARRPAFSCCWFVPEKCDAAPVAASVQIRFLEVSFRREAISGSTHPRLISERSPEIELARRLGPFRVHFRQAPKRKLKLWIQRLPKES